MKVCDHIHQVSYKIRGCCDRLKVTGCGDKLTVTMIVYQSNDRDSDKLMW
jgi:hypothetical protein